MSTSESPTSSQVVGHQGAQVDITQRPAIAVNGWFGVVVLAGCVAGVLSRPGTTGAALGAARRLRAGRHALVIVPPGQTSVVQFFGRYVGTVAPRRVLVGRCR